MNNLKQIEVNETGLIPLPSYSLLIDTFVSSQDVRLNSRALYKRTVKQFFNWLMANGLELKTLTRIEIIKYKEYLLEAGLSTLTIDSYLVAVRKFFEWAETNKYYPNVAKGIKGIRRKRDFRKMPLTSTQGKELLEHFESYALRDYAMVNLLIRTGIRTIELIRANVGDVTFKGDTRVLLIHGKGRDEKDNFVILSKKAYEPIKEYLETRQKVNQNSPLFISVSNKNYNQRLTTRSIRRIVKEGLRAIGLDNKEYTAHSLRHSFASYLFKDGQRLEHIQGALRHTNPATTQIYLKGIEQEMRLKNNVESRIDEIL